MKYKLPKGVHELSLRPYCGRVFICESKELCAKAYKIIYGQSVAISEHSGGKFYAGNDRNDIYTYLIWANDIPKWAHEIQHVILDLLPNLGFDLNNTACDEAACYLMQALLSDVIALIYEPM